MIFEGLLFLKETDPGLVSDISYCVVTAESNKKRIPNDYSDHQTSTTTTSSIIAIVSDTTLLESCCCF